MKSITTGFSRATAIALLATNSIIATAVSTTTASAEDLTVAYFLEWPTP